MEEARLVSHEDDGADTPLDDAPAPHDAPARAGRLRLLGATFATFAAAAALTTGRGALSRTTFAAGAGLARAGRAVQDWHAVSASSFAVVDGCACTDDVCDGAPALAAASFAAEAATPAPTRYEDWTVYFSNGVLETDGSGESYGLPERNSSVLLVSTSRGRRPVGFVTGVKKTATNVAAAR